MYHANVFQAKQGRSRLNPESRVCLDRPKDNAKVTSVRKWIRVENLQWCQIAVDTNRASRKEEIAFVLTLIQCERTLPLTQYTTSEYQLSKLLWSVNQGKKFIIYTDRQKYIRDNALH